MTKQEKCNLILKKMKEAGYEDTVDNCSDWTTSEINYFLDNYEEHYLGPSEDPMGDGDIPKVWP